MRLPLNSQGRNTPLPERSQWKKNPPRFILKTIHRRFSPAFSIQELGVSMRQGGLKWTTEVGFHAVRNEVVEVLAVACCGYWRGTRFKKQRDKSRRLSLRAIKYNPITPGSQWPWAAHHQELGERSRKPLHICTPPPKYPPLAIIGSLG